MPNSSQMPGANEPDRLYKIIEYLLFKSHYVLFCLIIFVLVRLILFQQLYWIDIATPLHLTPSTWLYRFDAIWYTDIATHGYSTQLNALHHGNYVFFPLLPLLTFIFSKLWFLPIFITGQVLSNLFFLGSLMLFYQYIKQRLQDERAARFGVILMALSPFNIYFASFYTESLFLLLSLATMFTAYQRRWWLAGLLATLLTLTRPNGIMIILPLFFMMLTDPTKPGFAAKKFLPLVLPLLSLGAYMLYLHEQIGDALAFIHGQASWGRLTINAPVSSLLNGTFQITYVYNMIIFVLSIMLIYSLLKRKFLNEALYFFAALLPAMLSCSLLSMARFSACLFTFYFALTVIAERKLYPWISFFLIEALYFGFYVSGWINNFSTFW
jgi:Mannosyltransferase (PIG-V)